VEIFFFDQRQRLRRQRGHRVAARAAWPRLSTRFILLISVQRNVSSRVSFGCSTRRAKFALPLCEMPLPHEYVRTLYLHPPYGSCAFFLCKVLVNLLASSGEQLVESGTPESTRLQALFCSCLCIRLDGGWISSALRVVQPTWTCSSFQTSAFIRPTSFRFKQLSLQCLCTRYPSASLPEHITQKLWPAGCVPSSWQQLGDLLRPHELMGVLGFVCVGAGRTYGLR